MKKKYKYLIIGASGYLGSALVSQLSEEALLTHFTKQLFPDSIRFNLFTDDLRFILQQHEIENIIFAAGVEMRNGAKEIKDGIGKLLVLAKQHAQRFVYISSDGIFDGKTGNYSEDQEPVPATHYGQNLLLCEKLVAEFMADHLIIRPSHIYGLSNLRGAVIPMRLDGRLKEFFRALQKNKEIAYFTDMYKCPIEVEQLAEIILQLAASEHRGIVHTAGERISIYDFFVKIASVLGLDTGLIVRDTIIGKNNPEILPDTSLDIQKMVELTGMWPKTVEETIREKIGDYLKILKLAV